ncbi:hypothetical protein BCR34DRAFT_575722 [Clohesyomyces aquaticus]|uniref:Uncharacterized protein n=1 Tax=Clohesyomyces aquaticus TaxID=1231657 RepID=A0A1Y1YR60_9PLEO|nr:hypothetical protein BCR34DRAFT_575722 [Clohesyomyces aquaticus]
MKRRFRTSYYGAFGQLLLAIASSEHSLFLRCSNIPSPWSQSRDLIFFVLNSTATTQSIHCVEFFI